VASGPTREDAKLLLQLYDLRREKALRKARDFVQRDCKFKDYKDFEKKYPPGAKERGYVGMVMGYWDMACTLVVKGLLNEELFNATTFEHVGVWFKLKPVAEGYRKAFQYAGMMQALETVATRHPGAAAMQAHLQKPGASKKRAAAGRR
jgi:hypothetical protein